MNFIRVLFIAFVFLFSTGSSLFGDACKKRTEICRMDNDCCPVMGRRMVCATHLQICGKRICCITEVEEQQEKQAAILRNRNPKAKRVWEYLLDEEEK